MRKTNLGNGIVLRWRVVNEGSHVGLQALKFMAVLSDKVSSDITLNSGSPVGLQIPEV